MKEIGQRIIEIQDKLIQAQGMFISYFKRYAGEAERITRFSESISIISDELSALRAEQGNPVEQSKLSAEDVYEVIESRISYFKEIYHKYEAIQLNNALHVIKNLVPPKQFEGKELPEEELREGLPENYMTLVRKALKEGHRLEAIKIHYENTKRASLKESKKIVDEIWNTEFKNR